MAIDTNYPSAQTLADAKTYMKALLGRIATEHEVAGVIADSLFAAPPSPSVVFDTDAESVARLQHQMYLLRHGTITSLMWPSQAGVFYALETDQFGSKLAAAIGDYVADCRNRYKALVDLIDAAASVAAALAVDLNSSWPSRTMSAVTPVPGFSFGTYIDGLPGASEVVIKFVTPFPMTAAAGLTGWQGHADTAATAQTDFDVQNGMTSFGTIRFAAAGTVPTFIAAAANAFAVGDVLRVVAPATPDATLAGISLTVRVTR